MFKDTVITARHKRRELTIMLICLGVAVVFNVIGIIKFSTPAKELVTQLHIVFLLALFFYAVTGLLRLIWWLISSLLIRRKEA